MKLKPIFKKERKTDPSNYRPISLLPVTSKIIEKVVHDQTNAFLSDENILYNYQSGFKANHLENLCLSFLTDKILKGGFKANHLTNLCLSFLTDKIIKGFDGGLLTEIILIDLQKAFDRIDYEILLQKLKAIRFSKGTLQWFRSYLSKRIILVNIESKFSAFGEIPCGVPQSYKSLRSPFVFDL